MRMESVAKSALALFFIGMSWVGPLGAEEDRHPYISAMRSLSVNRSLLTKTENEYRLLLKQEPAEPSEELLKRREDLRYKIQALKDDAQRLQDALPKDLKADEFLKELVVRQDTLGRTDSVDPERDRRIEEAERSVYRLHEKALFFVAERRYEEAAGLYEDITLISPEDDEAYLLLGHTRLVSGQYEKAGRAFHNALDIDPANAREIPRLYENILVGNPSDVEAMTQLGYACLLLGEGVRARTAFEEALKIDPAHLEAKKGLLELQSN